MSNLRNCIICNKEFEIRKNRGQPAKTCSLDCNKKYAVKLSIKWNKEHYERLKSHVKKYMKNHREYYLEKQKQWIKDNPEKYKIIQNKGFNKWLNKNRKQYNSNILTYQIVKKDNLLIKKCKSCNSIDNLEIHHEVYHNTIKEIKEDILKNKVYYLCTKCHSKITTNNNLNNQINK